MSPNIKNLANFRSLAIVFGIFLLSAGLVIAISATPPTVQNTYRWAGNAATGNVTTEGGNITDADVTGVTLTDKWAAFFGNVTGSIILDDDGTGNMVYSWSLGTNTTAGEVCVSTDSAFNWAGAQWASAGQIDGAWAFAASDADAAVSTYDDGNCTNMTFAQASVIPLRADIQGASTFDSCAMSDTGTPVTEGDFAFCSLIDINGTNYDGASTHYEVIVPTTEGPSALEIYYFFAEFS